MKSVSFALRSFAPILHISSVKLYTDNKAVAFITDSGSNKPHLNAIAKNIFVLLLLTVLIIMIIIIIIIIIIIKSLLPCLCI